MSVLREGVDREEHGEAPPPVLQGVGSRGGGPTAASGEWPKKRRRRRVMIKNTCTNHRKNKRKKLLKLKRRKFKCPHCSSIVVHLHRQLRNIHKYEENPARYYNINTNLRKKVVRKIKSKHIQYHKPVSCPVEGCSAIVIRLDIC